MALGTPTQIATNTSATATTTCSFTAQAAGTYLRLVIGADDYRTTSGAGRPESTGWALVTNGAQQTNLGHYVFHKIATGSETSVQYTIGSASKSVWYITAQSGVDSTTIYSGTPFGKIGVTGTFTADSGSTTPAAGNVTVYASFGCAQNPLAVTGIGSYTNSYTALTFNRIVGTGTGDAIGDAYLTYTANGSTATNLQGTWAGSNPDAQTAIIYAVKEAAGGGSSLTANPSDAEGITDSATEVQDYVRSQSDPVGLADAASEVQDYVRAPGDPVGLTDSLAVVWDRATTISDGVGVTDPGQSEDRSLTIADAVGITDSASSSQPTTQTANPADSVGLTDAVTVLWDRVTTVADLLGLADSISSSQSSAGSQNVNDPEGLTDGTTTTATRARQPSDGPGISDSVVAVLDRVATIADPVGLADAVTTTQTNPNAYRDITITVLADRSRQVTITEHQRIVTIRSHQ